MQSLYGKLSMLGLPKAYVRGTLLPDWWQDEAASNHAGYAEAVMYVARHAGVDPASLETEQPKLSEAVVTKFKRAKGTSEDDVALARSLATQVGWLVAAAISEQRQQLPEASDVRATILQSGRPWVSLDDLVDYCWSMGIPVVHVSNFPSTTKKMDGLSMNIEGRHVIILSKAVKQPAWLLFILAHEMGHIALGHVQEGQVLVDQKIDEDDTDQEEKQANAYALDLICGSPTMRILPKGRWPKAEMLAKSASALGRQKRIDPGHIVLNYARSMGSDFFAVANSALKFLDAAPDAVGVVLRKLAERLDWSALSDEASAFIMRMTGSDVSLASTDP